MTAPAAEVAVARQPAVPAQQQTTAAPATPVVVNVPQVGDAGQRITQCTVLVSADVRARFEYYQFKTRFDTGREPSNVIVVKRALNAAKKADRFGVILDELRKRRAAESGNEADPDDLFTEEVPGRRADRGRVKTTVQQSFRPSYQELATIDALWQAYGYPNRSEFLDAVLDAFLPQVPDKPRGRRA